MPHTPYTAPFLLIGRDGSTVEFANLADIWSHPLVAALAYPHRYDGRLIIGRSVNENALGTETAYEPVRYIVRDLYGRTIYQAEVIEAYKARTALNKRLVSALGMAAWSRKRALAATTLWRGPPIPGTGRRRSYAKRYLRGSIRSIGLRRAANTLRLLRVEEGVPIRGRATIEGLPPDPWDDIPRRDANDRSWKRFRRHQWK